MDTCFCDFCHQPCGQRQFCDETCHQEYQDEVKSQHWERPFPDTGEVDNGEYDAAF